MVDLPVPLPAFQAYAFSHGPRSAQDEAAELHSTDADFARFPGLSRLNPPA